MAKKGENKQTTRNFFGAKKQVQFFFIFAILWKRGREEIQNETAFFVVDQNEEVVAVVVMKGAPRKSSSEM